MRFNKLNEMIPYVTGGKPKVLQMHPYNGIMLAMPGRHAKDTTPVGGDFVVCVSDENNEWVTHQFTHADLFGDLERKARISSVDSALLMKHYLGVVAVGSDPEKLDVSDIDLPGIHPQTLLYAVQCLAVAEHRRYAQHEAKFGGRYLPFRAAAGIVEGLWSATDAADKTRKRGRIGIEWLEKDFGVPVLTKELMA